MEHFRVLPTDPRLDDIDDMQAAIMFQYWVMFDENSIRKAARDEIRKEASRPRFNDEGLRSMGYNDAQIAAIKRKL